MATAADLACHEAAVNFYVNLVRKYGEPGASKDGFTQCEAAYGEGKAAMWYDATVAAGLIATAYPKRLRRDRLRLRSHRHADGRPGVPSGWLYTWSLSIPKGVPNEAGDVEVPRMGDRKAVHRLQRPEDRLGEHRPGYPVPRRTRFPSTRRPRAHSPASRWRRSTGRIPTIRRTPM